MVANTSTRAAGEDIVDLYRESVGVSEVDQALAAYIDARDRMNGAHEEFVHAVKRQDHTVTESRQRFDAAEREMMRYRRRWWIALAWSCQERAASPTRG